MGSDDTVAFVISIDNGVTWTSANALQVWTTANQPSNAGDRPVFDLTGYTGIVKFGFYAASTVTNADYDVHIDNFAVIPFQTCPAPSTVISSNVTGTTAEITWTENGSALQWELEYGPTGFTPGTGMNQFTLLNPTTLTGLMSTSTYDVYVRAICAPGDTSLWSSTHSFNTACGIVTPTYREEFANYLPNCWEEADGILGASSILTATTSDWGTALFGNQITGSDAAYINVYGSTDREWLISPSIDLGTGAIPYELNFDIALTEYNDVIQGVLDADDIISVVVSTDNGATWSDANVLRSWTQGTEPSNTGDNVTLSLVGYTGVVKIGFYQRSTSITGDTDLFIDNFEVRLAPQQYGDLVISEIMYNPPEDGVDSLEFIEIYNNGPTTVDLTNMTLDAASTYTFPATSLNAGDYYVLAINASAFNTVYGFAADDVFAGGLSNSGRLLLLIDPTGNTVDSVDYDDGGVWPSGAAQGGPDNGGASLVLCDPNSDNADGANWSASTTSINVIVNGKTILASPGTDNGCPIPVDVMVDTLLLDEVYCNTAAVSGAFIVTNNTAGDATNVTYNVTLNGVIIGTGVIPVLTANTSDTIAVGPLPVVTGSGFIEASISFAGDVDNSNDTLGKMVYISNIDAAIANNGTIACNGDSTGSLTASTTDAYGMSMYMWNNGAMTASINNLPAGMYSVMATDSIGCMDSAMITITEPAAIMVMDTIINPSCNGDSTGAIMITSVTNGTAPYTYLWSNGAVTMNVMNIPAGTYGATITDANGCMTMASYTVIEPNAITITDTVNNVLCNGDSTGSIMILSTIGGTAPYTYMWSNGAMTMNAMNVPAGTYTVTVTDANGCMTMSTYTVTEPTALTLTIMHNNNDSATAMPVGGVMPYTYQWSANSGNQTTATATNLMNNVTYMVTVVDANGCEAMDSVDVSFINVQSIANVNSLAMFPNPTSAQVFVDLDLATATTVQINITNALGQLVSTQALGTIQTQRVELSTSDLPSGLYLVQFQIGEELVTRKLIVQRD